MFIPQLQAKGCVIPAAAVLCLPGRQRARLGKGEFCGHPERHRQGVESMFSPSIIPGEAIPLIPAWQRVPSATSGWGQGTPAPSHGLGKWQEQGPPPPPLPAVIPSFLRQQTLSSLPSFSVQKCQEHLQFLPCVKEHLSFVWSSSRSCLRDASLGF